MLALIRRQNKNQKQKVSFHGMHIAFGELGKEIKPRLWDRIGVGGQSLRARPEKYRGRSSEEAGHRCRRPSSSLPCATTSSPWHSPSPHHCCRRRRVSPRRPRRHPLRSRYQPGHFLRRRHQRRRLRRGTGTTAGMRSPWGRRRRPRGSGGSVAGAPWRTRTCWACRRR